MTKGFYVYVHRDAAGNIFYVGKGSGRRAWSKDRHGIWERYVSERLGGDYTVEIVEDGLSEDKALGLEARLMTEYREQLVNWFNEGSITYTTSISIDPDTGEPVISGDRGPNEEDKRLSDNIDRYWRLRNETRRLTAEAKRLQPSDPEAALSAIRQALEHVREYSLIHIPHPVALVESLMDRERTGDVDVIHRLVQILKALGRDREIVEEVDRYLDEFPRDLKVKRLAPVVRNRNAAARRLGLAERDPYSDD
jgi:hypothetical protein